MEWLKWAQKYQEFQAKNIKEEMKKVDIFAHSCKCMSASYRKKESNSMA